MTESKKHSRFDILNSKQRIESVFLVFLTLLTLSCNSDLESSNIQTEVLPTLTFDLINRTEVKNQVGFLHGIDASEPENYLIEPLKPRYWRAGSLTDEIYERVTGFGAEYIISVADLYGYPGEREQPYADPAQYITFLDNLSAETLNKPMIYDIWNEPDAINFWDGTQQQFLETFKLAHDRLRLNLGTDILIAGPSIAVFRQDYLIDFCDFALANNIKIDVLTFHWFRRDEFLPQLKDALDWCYEAIIDNPTYAALGIQKVSVGEYISQSQQYDAAYLLAKFDMMERGKSDGGCHACWPEDDGSLQNNCWNQSINGLLDSSGKPRAAWWAIKSYAEMDTKRAEMTSLDTSIFGLSGTVNNNTYRLIVGYNSFQTDDLEKQIVIGIDNLNELNNFSNKNNVTIAIYRILDSGFESIDLNEPFDQYSKEISSQIILNELSISPDEIYIIDISDD